MSQSVETVAHWMGDNMLFKEHVFRIRGTSVRLYYSDSEVFVGAQSLANLIGINGYHLRKTKLRAENVRARLFSGQKKLGCVWVVRADEVQNAYSEYGHPRENDAEILSREIMKLMNGSAQIKPSRPKISREPIRAEGAATMKFVGSCAVKFHSGATT